MLFEQESRDYLGFSFFSLTTSSLMISDFCSIGVELVLSDFEKVSSGGGNIDKKEVESESYQGNYSECGNFLQISRKKTSCLYLIKKPLYLVWKFFAESKTKVLILVLVCSLKKCCISLWIRS